MPITLELDGRRVRLIGLQRARAENWTIRTWGSADDIRLQGAVVCGCITVAGYHCDSRTWFFGLPPNRDVGRLYRLAKEAGMFPVDYLDADGRRIHHPPATFKWIRPA